ncbi:hypothetical protein KQ945_11500 [Bacillus subtilis subsp. subtilis]|nr:hypothetical protein [Bacillus subtilis subsp. subtilis]
MKPHALRHADRAPQRGVVTLEFAFMLILGLVPLLLLTYTGVMIMAAQQTLSLASAEGARASLRYASPNDRRIAACQAAQRSMQWLLNFSGQQVNCSNAGTPPIVVSAPAPCAGLASAQCMQVSVSYDYRSKPFLPGTGSVYGWLLTQPIRSTAVAQLDLATP